MIGRILSHYRIEEWLGGGAMGVVYRAVDVKLDRPVALKFLSPESARDETAKSRFIHEAKTASRLDHPNVASVYEIGEADDGRLFIVMPFYRGETLKQKIDRGPIAVGDALEWALRISRGLRAAHAAGIVHRDLKPANVMVTIGGEVKILDFGLAKSAGVDLTATGATVGTAAYMSPEQARGEPVDGRTDLWSLGTILFELLSGVRPFEGPYLEAVIYSILHEKPPSVREIRPDVSEATAELIDELLKKDAAARPADAEVVARRLGALRERGTPAYDSDRSSAAVGLPEWLSSRTPHSRRLILLAAAFAVFAGLLIYLGLRPDSFRDEIGPPNPRAGSAAAITGDWTPRLGLHSIAVLPFTYLGAEDSSDYFSQGMTDELLIRLSQIEDLSVISRTSVMRFLNSDKSIPEIAQALGVAYVLEGNVQQVGGYVRIQAQLIDGRTDRNVWSDGVTRPFRDVLKLQVDLAQEIAAALPITVLPDERRRVASAVEVDSTAYALYLQARRLNQDLTRESLSTAVALALRSVDVDSSYAPAWAMLSVSAMLAPWYGITRPGGLAADSLATAAARRAINLDPTNAEAQMAMGMLGQELFPDFPEEGSYLERAVRLNPNLATAHRAYGLYFMKLAEFERAERYLSRAAQLDPASPQVWAFLADNEISRGNYERAKEYARQQVLLESNRRGSISRAVAYALQDSLDAARAELQAAAAGFDSAGSWPLALLGRAYALAGMRESALAVVERINRDFGPAVWAEGMIRAALGETGRALDLLEQTEWAPLLRLKVDPAFRHMQNNVRYHRLLEKGGLDDAAIRRKVEVLGEAR